MNSRHPILRGLGLLGVFILVIFAGAFFFAYFTGGDARVLSMFASDGVGVLLIDGAIDDSRQPVSELKRLREAAWIKAVVVRIDSPGGGVAPTQEIFEAIRKFKGQKPVIASMGSTAASGGYYIATACDKIIANPGTLTGSIGVIMQLANVEELMRKVGVRGYNIKSGPNKDVGSPFAELSPEGRAILQGLVENVHGQFVSAVARARDMDEGVVRKLSDGRVYSGAQAKALGLVDELGTFQDAIELAAKQAGIEGQPAIFYSTPERESVLDRMFFGLFGVRLPRGGETGWLRYEWSPSLLR
jgi:protease-4